MQASKLTVSQETLRFNRMTKGKRSQLRRQNMIDLIQSKPAGTPISLVEFQQAGGYPSISAPHALLKTMLKNGIIARHPEGLRQYSYTVLNQARPKKQPAKPQPPKAVEVSEPTEPSFGSVENLAREFAWAQNSDSLRDFIQWAKIRAMDKMTGKRGTR